MRAQRAHDQRYRHRRLQSFAAYVAQGNQRTAVGGGNDLEEVTAYLFRRTVDAGNGQTGNRRRLLGHEDLLHFAGRLYFQFDTGLPLPFQEVLPGNGEDQGQEQECAENKPHVEEINHRQWKPRLGKSGLTASNG